MKPSYVDELRLLVSSYDWASREDISLLAQLLDSVVSGTALYIGSGGALAVAALASALHIAKTGQLATYTIPLAVAGGPLRHSTAAVLFSARAGHPDVALAVRATVRHSASVQSVAFSPDGQRVVSGSEDAPNSRWDYMILIWNVDESAWRRRACHIAGRNFTWDEWRRYIGKQPYERTCSRSRTQDPEAPDYPVHPTVIEAWLDEAANHFKKQKVREALQRYQDALVAAEASPVQYDMIALFLAKLQAFRTNQQGNPLIPRMRQQLDVWVAQQPETNRQYWHERFLALDKH